VLAAVLTASAPIEALRYARELCALQPEDLGSRLLLAEALIASGNTPEGTELYRQIQQALSPEDPNYQRIEQRLRRLSPQPAPAQTAPVKTP